MKLQEKKRKNHISEFSGASFNREDRKMELKSDDEKSDDMKK